MSGPQFYQTHMGQSFFEGTVPRLCRAVERVADALTATKKEYKVVGGKTLAELEHELNELGEQGFVFRSTIWCDGYESVLLERARPKDGGR